MLGNRYRGNSMSANENESYSVLKRPVRDRDLRRGILRKCRVERFLESLASQFESFLECK